MDSIEMRNNIIEVGRVLLNEGLVARTWGNISARQDDDNFLITPSGLDYISMTDEDIVSVNITSGEWKGSHKPSGERGVHKAAYQAFPEVNFVVHTHQIYATAVGIAGFNTLDITPDEKERLGGIGLAAYGLPGSDKLTNAVADALKAGAHVVFMMHHGVLVCGENKEDAMERVRLLEEICKRNTKGKVGSDDKVEIKSGKTENTRIIISDDIIAVANSYNGIVSQLDDVSQMIGGKIKVVNEDRMEKAISKTSAVLVKNVGALIKADDEDDFEALAVLIQKMAVVRLHTKCLNNNAKLSFYDSYVMHKNYVNNYSKQKANIVK